MCIPTPERARRSGNTSDLAFGKIVAKCSSFIIACQGYDVTERDGIDCLGDLTPQQLSKYTEHSLRQLGIGGDADGISMMDDYSSDGFAHYDMQGQDDADALPDVFDPRQHALAYDDTGERLVDPGGRVGRASRGSGYACVHGRNALPLSIGKMHFLYL